KKRKHSEFISSLPRKFEQEKFMEDVKIEFLKYLEISKERNDLKDFYRKDSSESKRLFLEKYQNKDFIFQKP
ncbi:MAG: lipoate--protein ligase family protein, partial [Leptospiraceae bacterium]|nr:lipoate--protein ligase family protein [Leptospiraceae bacterium]